MRADGLLEGSYLIALTGYALPQDVQQATAAGFDRHVSKPPSIQRLERLFALALPAFPNVAERDVEVPA